MEGSAQTVADGLTLLKSVAMPPPSYQMEKNFI